MARDVRAEMTEKLMEAIKSGEAPWQKPWEARAGAAPQYQINADTGKAYRGGNQLFLTICAGRSEDPRWCTFLQAQKNGWKIKKGSKGVPVEYFSFDSESTRKEIDEKTGEEKTVKIYGTREIPVQKVYTVFHASQVEGIPPYESKIKEPPQEFENRVECVERASDIMDASGAKINHDQSDRAFYRPATDSIHLPKQEQFKDTEGYYSTALHELGHWTGHESRLDRKGGTSFGDTAYAKEELRAEIASYFLSVELGVPITQEHIDQHGAYVKGWLSALEKDKHELFRAVKDAEKITEYVLGFERGKEQAAEKTDGKNATQDSEGAPKEKISAQEYAALTIKAMYGQIKSVEEAKNGEVHKGPIVAETKAYAVQEVGKGKFVLHKLKALGTVEVGKTKLTIKTDAEGKKEISAEASRSKQSKRTGQER